MYDSRTEETYSIRDEDPLSAAVHITATLDIGRRQAAGSGGEDEGRACQGVRIRTASSMRSDEGRFFLTHTLSIKPKAKSDGQQPGAAGECGGPGVCRRAWWDFAWEKRWETEVPRRHA